MKNRPHFCHLLPIICKIINKMYVLSIYCLHSCVLNLILNMIADIKSSSNKHGKRENKDKLSNRNGVKKHTPLLHMKYFKWLDLLLYKQIYGR